MLRHGTVLAMVFTFTGLSTAAVKTEAIDYDYDGTKLKGFLAYDDAVQGKRPGVLVVHEWWGLNDYAKDRCKKLAELGYTAFACDMYGAGKLTTHPMDAAKFATEVRSNLKAWRGRAAAGLKILADQPTVDADKLAAIGYCFGGSTCLQLAYTGAPVKAVATFHAALPTPSGDEAKAINAKLLLCHGEADKFIPEKAIQDFRSSLDAAKVKYDFISYPGVVHSFTVPEADKVGNPGMKYDRSADEDSWKRMLGLFKVTLGK